MTAMTKYLPILDELFHSDSCLFLLIGFAVGFAGSSTISLKKRALTAAAVSFGIYVLCELLLNFVGGSFMLELLGLFTGTAALGAAIAFSVRFAILKNDKPAEPDLNTEERA